MLTTLNSLRYISSFLPAGHFFWLANRLGSLEWKDLDRRAANTSLPRFTHYHTGSGPPCTWGAATLICLNLRAGGCLCCYNRSIWHDGRLAVQLYELIWGRILTRTTTGNSCGGFCCKPVSIVLFTVLYGCCTTKTNMERTGNREHQLHWHCCSW